MLIEFKLSSFQILFHHRVFQSKAESKASKRQYIPHFGAHGTGLKLS